MGCGRWVGWVAVELVVAGLGLALARETTLREREAAFMGAGRRLETPLSCPPVGGDYGGEMIFSAFSFRCAFSLIQSSRLVSCFFY